MRWVVEVHPEHSVTEVVDACKARGLDVHVSTPKLNEVAVTGEKEAIEQVTGVTGVTEDQPARHCTTETHSGTIYDYPDELVPDMNLQPVYDAGHTGSGMKIGIIDTGFDFATHEYFTGQVVKEDETRVSSPSPDHGTSCAGCAAGSKIDGVKFGMAYDASIYAYAVGFASEHRNAVVELCDVDGVDVISSSLSYRRTSGPVETSWQRSIGGVQSQGIVYVQAAGNWHNDSVAHEMVTPAVHRGSVVVGATKSDNSITDYSSRGALRTRFYPDVVAAGNQMCADYAATSGYVPKPGTSFAAPSVAGLIACCMGGNSDLDGKTIKQALFETSTNKATPDNSLGYGFPDGDALLGWVDDHTPYTKIGNTVDTVVPATAVREVEA